ncbi:beta-fructosidase [Corynebacterium diphtheriae]|nr:beta-fructosidase [Corynebacterium diphtheriae]
MTHRPELHVTPEIGILDAPAGALFDGTTWHLFHQFRPKATAPSRWAHDYATTDPFNWEICDDVIAPQGDEIRLRAGSITSDGKTTRLYFTSITNEGDSIHLAEITDLDATTYDVNDDATATDPHVTRLGQVVADQGGYTNFRSPCVVPNWVTADDRDEGHSGWIMLAVTGDMDEPTLVILDSENGTDWELRGPLKVVGNSGIEGERLVAPRIIRLRDEIDQNVYDILIVTIEIGGIDRSGYLVGKLHNNIFTVVSSFTRIDYGHDFTRPRNTNYTSHLNSSVAPEHRYSHAHVFGLMNGIGRLDDATTHLSFREEQWANCLSLPRRMTLQGGKIYHTPVAGLPDAIRDSDHAIMWTGLLDVPLGEKVTVELVDTTGNIAAKITHYGDLLELDRSMNPHHEGDDIAVAPLTEDDTDSVTIIVDGSTVEVFADGGQIAMASRVYFNGYCEAFTPQASDGADILRSDVTKPLG